MMKVNSKGTCPISMPGGREEADLRGAARMSCLKKSGGPNHMSFF